MQKLALATLLTLFPMASVAQNPAKVPCAQEAGEALGLCTARVAHLDDGQTRVTVTFPNGFARILIFEGQTFLRGNATMSGVGTDTDWQVIDGIHQIRVDDQQFRIDEALLLAAAAQ